MKRFIDLIRPSIILVFVFILASCEKKEICNDKEINTWIIESDYDMGKCFYFLDSSNYIIDNIKEYQSLVDKIDSTYIANTFSDCANYELYSIDFTNITLLALYAEGRGCSTAFQRDVQNDPVAKQYVYTITVFECGNCDITEVSMNWVQVPKLPDNYSVEFKVVKN